jgi:hypothetical protein
MGKPFLEKPRRGVDRIVELKFETFRRRLKTISWMTLAWESAELLTRPIEAGKLW